MQQINIEQIMEQIRAEIKERGYTGDMLDFEGLPMNDRKGHENIICDDFADIAGHMQNNYFLAWRHPVPLGIKGFVKKLIYKCIGFAVAPITEEQSRYNSIFAAAIGKLCAAAREQEKVLKEQKKMIELLEERIFILENKK